MYPKKQVFDVVVVGNGVLGLSLALTLARKKLSVALVGESQKPWSASTAAGAMLAVYGEVTSTLLESKYGRLKHNLAVRSLKLWDDWIDGLSDEFGKNDIRVGEGTVVLLNNDGYWKVDELNFEAIRRSLKENNEPFEDLDSKDIEWLDSYPSSHPNKAIYIPGEGAVNPIKLLYKMEQAFIRLGGTIINEVGLSLVQNSGRVEALVLQSGERIISNKIVLAAGVKSQDLLNTLPDIAAGIPRLVSGVGFSAVVKTVDGSSPNNVIRTPNRAFACGLHIVPRQKGEIYVGATNAFSLKPEINPTLDSLTYLLDGIYRQFRRNLSKGRITRFQVGNRPYSIDGFPLLGETDLSGLWLMTGTYRDGLTQSPYLAREMANQITGEDADPDLELFTPIRKPIQEFTRKEIIDETVEHILASGYEMGWRMPIGSHYIIEKNMHQYYEKLANDLHPSITPPADILEAAGRSMGMLKMLLKYYNNISSFELTEYNKN